MKKLALILIFLALAAPALAQEEATTEEITTPEEGTAPDEGVIPDEPEAPITTDVTGEEPIIGTEVSPQEETIPGPRIETLFDQELLDFGGFGGAVLKVTKLKDEWTLLLGGAWRPVNKSFHFAGRRGLGFRQNPQSKHH